jgi:hypothetical protein
MKEPFDVMSTIDPDYAESFERSSAGSRDPWRTNRTISHTEAREIATRLINSHFNKEPHARVGIPARPDYDDDLLIVSYIKQQEEKESGAPAQGSLNREQMLERAISEACDLLAERTYGNAARSPGHNARLRLEQALVAQVYAAQPPAAPVEQDEMLSRLVDWAYLHALEGAAWPSTKTKQMLIARARQDKPTQDHADGMKAVAPRSSADNIERWIDQNFSGHGRALRTLQEPPIDGEPFMSMEDAKQLLRDGIAKFCHPPQTPSVPSGEIEALAAHLEGHPSSWDADKIRRAASYLRGRSFRPCPGCDGYECKNECMYPGVAAVTRPHQRGGS